MVRPRSIYAGMTNFMGSSIEDIIHYLNSWKESLDETINNLNEKLDVVNNNKRKFHYTQDITSYITFFIDTFERYISEISRLLIDIQSNVSQANIKLLQNIYDDSRSKVTICVDFKRKHIETDLKDEHFRFVLDQIYGTTMDMIIDLSDVSNLISVLTTFVSNSTEQDDIIGIKPNFFGFSFNLNALFKKIKKKILQRK